MSETAIPPQASDTPVRQLTWSVALRRAIIWALFLALVYLARDFFFMAFMSFLICYMTLALVALCMKRFSPNQERPWLRRLLTVAVFVLAPLALIGVGVLVAPRLLEQGKHLAAWLSRVSPETEVARLLEGFVGPSEFKQHYSGPDDPNYQKDLAAFRATGVLHVKEYQEFPQVEAWVEGGFEKQYAEAERGRIRTRLLQEGTSSKEFEQWFRKVKVPELLEQSRKPGPAKDRSANPEAPLVRAAATAKPEQLLQQARHDAALMAALRDEWLQDSVTRALATVKGSTAYQAEFRKFYEKRVKEAPTVIPFTFEQYLELQKVRPQGALAFGAALEKLNPTSQGESEARLRNDFEAAKKHELFQQWWGSSSIAKFVRHQVEASESGAGSDRVERILSSLLNIPVDLGTALLISFFICIDFGQMKRAMQSLQGTWLRDVYDEIAPALTNLGQLVGRAMHAQGLIAVCNATMMFLALTFLGVEHAVLLSVAMFVLCLVPTLGTILAWVLIAAVALVQPGGGLGLALKVSAAVVLVMLVETFVLSPRILGRMMELHPVLIISILPVAQYFFGVWGLILATPVAVYIIHVVILQRGLPGGSSPEPTAIAEPNVTSRPAVAITENKPIALTGDP